MRPLHSLITGGVPILRPKCHWKNSTNFALLNPSGSALDQVFGRIIEFEPEYAMKLFAKSPDSRNAPGFSLVEVALAVAIAAVGIITCLGLLPEGLEMSRRTAQMAINSNILEQLIRDVENAGWPYLNIQTGKVKKYYNDQGSEVAEDAKDLTYVVEVDYSNPAYIPAASNDLKLQSNLKRLVIRIATTTNSKFEFTGKNPALYTTFNHLVAKDRPVL